MKPKELSQEECTSLLSKGRYGRLGLSSDNVPYVVPMAYVYSKGRIYLHSRNLGKKVEFVRKNPRICFEVDLLDKNHWSSVLAFGNARLSSDLETKHNMFDAFIEKDIKGHGGKAFHREELAKMDMIIWEIEIEEITGREGMW